jgi:hypothetical protein
MGLADFRRGRTPDANPQAERRNGDGSDGDVERDLIKAVVLGRTLLDAITDVVEELLKRRDEEARKDHPTESAAADDSHDGATAETEMETREPERSKKN